MKDRQNIVKEIKRVETITLNVKREIKTLKNRVRAYKGWTKRYRKQQKELKQTNLVVCQERDRAIQELDNLRAKQKVLIANLEKANQAAQKREIAFEKLDEVIGKIEKYREICDNAFKMTYADKIYLIKKAEQLFFDDPVIVSDDEINPEEKPWMFTDQRSIGRDLSNI